MIDQIKPKGLQNLRGRRCRSSRGNLGALMFLLGILITLLIACLSIDVAHFVSASTEMQNVVDAAALAGAYDLQWSSTPAEASQALVDAKYMVQNAWADLYSPSGVQLPTSGVNVSFSSLNGGTSNAITVSMNPPIVYFLAPYFIGSTNANRVGVSATAERLPVDTGPVPPWFLETTDQGGPPGPAPLPSPAPAPPSTFPASGYITFTDVKGGQAKIAPPILPTYWVDMGLTSLSTAKPNPPGIKSVLECLGSCVTGTPCSATNPVQIGVTTITAVHGSYNSNVSNPDANSAIWTNGSTVLIPICTNGVVTGVYAVKLTGPYVPNSFAHGQGVFGEFGIKFLGRADNVPGVTVFNPTSGQKFANVGATVAVLVK